MKYICLGSFLAASSVFAFNPDATGWYGESAINTGITHSNDVYHWFYDVTPSTTQLDLIFQQSVGYQRYITAEFQFLLGMPLGGGDVFHSHTETSNRTWRMDVDLFTSIDLFKNKSVYLEPVLGYEYLKEKIGYGSSGYYWNVDNRASAHGPKAGLYLRFYPVQNFGVRLGSSLLMLAFSDRTTESMEYGYGTLRFGQGRKGLSTSLSMTYSPKSYLTIEGAVESRTVSSRGNSPDEYEYTNAHYLTQNSISWGVRWNY